MKSLAKLHIGVILASVVLIGFAIPHFVDDFLYDVPHELGLTNVQGQILGGIFFALLTFAITLAGRGSKIGFIGTAIFGFLLTLAAMTYHLSGILLPEPYWGGTPSEVFIIGLALSGLALGILSILALRTQIDQT